MFNSLNEYITALEKANELLRINCTVSTEYEIAEITDRISKSEGGGKALLFTSTGTDFPVITNMFGSSKRIAMALGVDNLDNITERIDQLLGNVASPKETFLQKIGMLPMLFNASKWLPRIKRGKRGSCQDIVLLGEEANLNALPILKCWPGDGGKFITLPMVHTIDPISGARNVGMYRMQIFDSHSTGMHWHKHKTGARHAEGYRQKGERMPIAVTIGGDPVYTYCATAPLPDGVDEYLLAGFLRDKPVSLVKCITNDIYVPADCDFVLEGYIDPKEQNREEGPFGDHTGFYSLTDLYPTLHITAITHRHNAIYPATIVGIPPQEDAYISKATEKIFLSPIKFALLPEVKDITMPIAGVSHNLTIVKINEQYQGQATKVATALWGSGQMMFNKYMAVVSNKNIDIRNNVLIADLISRVDIPKAVIRGNGIYDVLDHATATNGIGGKLAVDLGISSNRSNTWDQLNIDGVSENTTFLDRWGVVILFVNRKFNIEQLPKQFGCKAVAIFDKSASSLSGSDLLWLGCGNTEPNRDIKVVGDSLVIDCRPKVGQNSDNPQRWPNVIVSNKETIDKVNNRWAEYNIGEIIQSPSEKYSPLLSGEEAQYKIL